ncbi:MAG: NAD(P)H-binding protein [Acidobacteriota bacterium]
MFLITGPTGNTGSYLRQRLRASGHPTTSMVRRQDAFDQLTADGERCVMADFDDAASLATALRHVERAFLVCTPDEALEARESRFVDAAAAAGVRRVVKISALGADAESASPNLRAHAAIEDRLRASGMDATILRPNGFMQTLVWMSLPMIQAQGVFAGPAGQGTCAHVDLRDVGEAAFLAMTDETPRNGVFDLTGPAPVTMTQVASWLSAALGQPVQYLDVPPEQMAGGMRQMGVAESSVAHVLTIFEMIRKGEFDFTSDGFDAFGITPRDWPTCMADLAAGLTAAATSFAPPPGAGGGPPPNA